MKFNRCMDTSNFPEATDMNINEMNINMTSGMGMEGCGCMPQNSCCSMPQMCPPIMECPQVRCCHRVINYEVPHIIPCHTKMINHHVYRHTYQPCYSYSEENESSEIYGPHCC